MASPRTRTSFAWAEFMPPRGYREIKDALSQLYAEDARPWLVGFSGGKDSTMLASLIFDAVLFIPAALRLLDLHRG
jgi:DNA sulfur modification protein DndC